MALNEKRANAHFHQARLAALRIAAQIGDGPPGNEAAASGPRNDSSDATESATLRWRWAARRAMKSPRA